MKRLFVILLCLITVGLCSPILADERDETVLPLQFFSSQMTPALSITIQGHEIPLVLDSGATSTSIVLNRDVAQKLNLKLTSSGTSGTCFQDASGKRDCSKIKNYVIPEVTIGQLVMHNVPCVLLPHLWGDYKALQGFTAAENGVIGLDFMRQFNVLLDYQHSVAIFTKLGRRPKNYPIQNWLQVPFTSKYNSIMTKVKINGYDAELLWDTGAISIIKIAAHIRYKKEFCANDDLGQYYTMATLQLDKYQFPKTKFYLKNYDLPFDGFIGSTFLKTHRVFFDFKNNILFIK